VGSGKHIVSCRCNTALIQQPIKLLSARKCIKFGTSGKFAGDSAVIIFMASCHSWQIRMSWDNFREQRGKIVEVRGKSICKNKLTTPLTTSAVLIFVETSQIQQVQKSDRIFRNNETRHLDEIFQSQIFCYHTRLYTHIFFSTTICTCFFGEQHNWVLWKRHIFCISSGPLFSIFFVSEHPVTAVPAPV
jgi:hypothetical protein